MIAGFVLAEVDGAHRHDVETGARGDMAQPFETHIELSGAVTRVAR